MKTIYVLSFVFAVLIAVIIGMMIGVYMTKPPIIEYDNPLAEVKDMEIEQWAEGDAGENPPIESATWPAYHSDAHAFYFHYPPEYKTVVDNYGWPNAVVHLISVEGGQSYDVTVDVWGNEDEAASAGRLESAIPFFTMVEHPMTGEYISITCWNSDENCEDISRTMGFIQF